MKRFLCILLLFFVSCDHNLSVTNYEPNTIEPFNVTVYQTAESKGDHYTTLMVIGSDFNLNDKVIRVDNEQFMKALPPLPRTHFTMKVGFNGYIYDVINIRNPSYSHLYKKDQVYTATLQGLDATEHIATTDLGVFSYRILLFERGRIPPSVIIGETFRFTLDSTNNIITSVDR